MDRQGCGLQPGEIVHCEAGVRTNAELHPGGEVGAFAFGDLPFGVEGVQTPCLGLERGGQRRLAETLQDRQPVVNAAIARGRAPILIQPRQQRLGRTRDQKPRHRLSRGVVALAPHSTKQVHHLLAGA
ncbi:hypothetical protein D3C85_1279310 [compost metagenome]